MTHARRGWAVRRRCGGGAEAVGEAPRGAYAWCRCGAELQDRSGWLRLVAQGERSGGRGGGLRGTCTRRPGAQGGDASSGSSPSSPPPPTPPPPTPPPPTPPPPTPPPPASPLRPVWQPKAQPSARPDLAATLAQAHPHPLHRMGARQTHTNEYPSANRMKLRDTQAGRGGKLHCRPERCCDRLSISSYCLATLTQTVCHPFPCTSAPI